MGPGVVDVHKCCVETLSKIRRWKDYALEFSEAGRNQRATIEPVLKILVQTLSFLFQEKVGELKRQNSVNLEESMEMFPQVILTSLIEGPFSRDFQDINKILDCLNQTPLQASASGLHWDAIHMISNIYTELKKYQIITGENLSYLLNQNNGSNFILDYPIHRLPEDFKKVDLLDLQFNVKLSLQESPATQTMREILPYVHDDKWKWIEFEYIKEKLRRTSGFPKPQGYLRH
ncbi:hypothetical protein PGTUg99_003563 [Puccinia graminis f. sp. tritici]|uniref:Uncharacterized protein n=1 Tax=Puccinia graminis f. sp. tritici TaxID=56615 RepID=A0A5B0QDW6_PUCGR|nr:hypothetical protein PGTUg99_003563 [Puccinia graminis f. sp. tritici]